MNRCEVCAADITRDPGRCTNRRCARCHAQHCTEGGVTSPGHERGTVATRDSIRTPRGKTVSRRVYLGLIAANQARTGDAAECEHGHFGCAAWPEGPCGASVAAQLEEH